MTITLFHKLIFKIAHQWCTHIDLNEYIEFLEKLYHRIIVKKAVKADGTQVPSEPLIQVELFQEDVTNKASGDDDWIECASDESSNSLFEYKYMEDPEQLVVKKMKKVKAAAPEEKENAPVFMTVREPFSYKEQVFFFPGDYEPSV